MSANPFEELEIKLERIERLLEKVLHKPTHVTPIHDDEIGDISLAQKITGLKKSTIYCHISKNKIPHFKKGGRVYFSKLKLIEWLTVDTRGSPTQPPPFNSLILPIKNKYNKP